MSDILLARTEVATEYVLDHERRIDIVIQNPRFLSLSKSKFMPQNRRGNATIIINMQKFSACLSDKVWKCPSGNTAAKRNQEQTFCPLTVYSAYFMGKDICGWLNKLTAQLAEPRMEFVKTL